MYVNVCKCRYRQMSTVINYQRKPNQLQAVGSGDLNSLFAVSNLNVIIYKTLIWTFYLNTISCYPFKNTFRESCFYTNLSNFLRTRLAALEREAHCSFMSYEKERKKKTQFYLCQLRLPFLSFLLKFLQWLIDQSRSVLIKIIPT